MMKRYAIGIDAVSYTHLFGMLLGFINGGAAVLFKIDPLIVSIATMTAFQGVANLISGGLSYNNFPDVFRVITRGSLFGIPMDVWIAIIAVAVASLVYNFTYYGRFVKAMGCLLYTSRCV